MSSEAQSGMPDAAPRAPPSAVLTNMGRASTAQAGRPISTSTCMVSVLPGRDVTRHTKELAQRLLNQLGAVLAGTRRTTSTRTASAVPYGILSAPPRSRPDSRRANQYNLNKRRRRVCVTGTAKATLLTIMGGQGTKRRVGELPEEHSN